MYAGHEKFKGFMTDKVRKSLPFSDRVWDLVPNGAFFICVPVATKGRDHTEKDTRKGFHYSDGWNGSYHECSHFSFVLAWARGSHKIKRAKSMLKKALAFHADRIAKDSCTARFEARVQVRSGD